MESFWEKVVLPMLHFTTFACRPMPLVTRMRSPKLAIANGQFMLFRRGAYERIGGHEAVRAALVEDVWLARRVKRFGYRLAIRYGGDLVACRMYTSLKEIWAGFSRNLFAGSGYSIALSGGMVLFHLLTSVVPFAMAMAIALEGGGATPFSSFVAAEVGVLLAIRFLLALRFDVALWAVLLHPIAVLLLMTMAVNSCRWVLAGGGSRWKGRVYDFRDQPV
jgi:chlorobactene glucosyltransferase